MTTVIASWYDADAQSFGGGEMTTIKEAKDQARKACARALIIHPKGNGKPSKYYLRRSEKPSYTFKEVAQGEFRAWARVSQAHLLSSREVSDSSDPAHIMSKMFVRAEAKQVLIQDELRLRAYRRLHIEGHISTHQLQQQGIQSALCKAGINTLLVKLRVEPLQDADIEDSADEYHEDAEILYEIAKRRHCG